MQLHLEGSSELKQDLETAYNRLTNLEVMARALPDTEDVKVIDSDTAEATVKLKLAVVSTRLRMRVKISGRRPPSHAELSAEGSGSGNRVKIFSTFDLERAGTENRTKMTWSANAEINGLMAGIGSMMLKGFAEKRMDEMFDAIGIAVEKPTT
jgi:carbon monoxide dehydrogenase subunit G